MVQRLKMKHLQNPKPSQFSRCLNSVPRRNTKFLTPCGRPATLGHLNLEEYVFQRTGTMTEIMSSGSHQMPLCHGGDLKHAQFVRPHAMGRHNLMQMVSQTTWPCAIKGFVVNMYLELHPEPVESWCNSNVHLHF